ncbi:TnsA endonuclease N-terminal domain-containing protein [Hydrogenophaga sp. PBL-H3]|uniref:TnsA endonuclease N-terminal domain-containing protein n=1 Tax=Hydrogenophaga sp. PBL-H3 TaxID=434010 RepID=UPI0013595CF0|nr:TnsA endonuclease N-terminal domain-containing protein [Hydrogenophaga sp. PBL-H3]
MKRALGATEQLPGTGRARKVVTRRGKKIRGKFPSKKLGKIVEWESLIERDAILMMEYHPAVLRYQEQPSEETYYDASGNARRCYPDFSCDLASGKTILLEIKSAKELDHDKKMQRKLGQIALSFARQGRPYRVLTDKEIRRQPLHANLLRLHDAHRATLPHTSEPHLPISVARNSAHVLGTWAEMLGSETIALGHIARGRLRTDLELALTSESLVWMPSYTEAGDGSFSL